MSKTGYQLGQLNPIYYYENARGHVMLAPSTEQARYCWERPGGDGKSLRQKGYEFKEAGTLKLVDALQAKLVEQERKKDVAAADRDLRSSERMWKSVGSTLYGQLVSAKTSEYEKDFIRYYLQVREEKRAEHRQRWLERQCYLEAAAFDSSSHAVDRMKSEPGDIWRPS